MQLMAGWILPSSCQIIDRLWAFSGSSATELAASQPGFRRIDRSEGLFSAIHFLKPPAHPCRAGGRLPRPDANGSEPPPFASWRVRVHFNLVNFYPNESLRHYRWRNFRIDGGS